MAGDEHVNDVFRRVKQALISRLGNKALSNHDLDRVCYRLFKRKYVGTFPQDMVKLEPGFQIINTDVYGNSGVHWVALYITKRNIYVYDSFGRKTSALLKILTRAAKKGDWNIIESDRDPEQRGQSEVCGVLCIAWLLMVDGFGVRSALKI